MSYAIPRLYDRDAKECQPQQMGLDSAATLSAASSARGESGEIVFDAVPIPGRQNVSCTEDTCGL